LLAENAVEQRRLAGVGAPEHRYAQRLRRVGLAAVLLLAEGERRRLVLIVGVEPRRGRQRGGERLMKFAQAFAVFGRERDRLAEAEPERLVGALTAGEPLG